MTERQGNGGCAAVIVAAGSARRMGFDKLAADLCGVAVLHRTVEAFLAAETISHIVVVCPLERWTLLAGLPQERLTRCDGGESRAESVANGIAALEATNEWVAVHDGARPLIAPDEIDRCVRHAMRHGAAALARRATETMKRGDADGRCVAPLDRDNVWLMETPQVARRDDLMRALSGPERALFTDEASALIAAGQDVWFCESLRPNLKITTPGDLSLAVAMRNLS
jgi:2-C-methyl-D-erythritol 4-phosphate cytidylyltransferase